VGITDPDTSFKLAIGAAEGCWAHYPAADLETRPVREAFNGVITRLPSDTLWGAWVILEQYGSERRQRTVYVDPETRFEPSTVTPEIGDIVRVEAQEYDDVWHAVRVVFRGADEIVRYVGTVIEIDDSAAARGGSRPDWIRVDAFPNRVRIVDDTRVSGELEVGVRVEIEGTLEVSGDLTAARVEVQQDPVNQVVEVRGVVQASEEANQLGPGVQLWFLNKYQVEVDPTKPSVRWQEGPPYDRRPAPGDRFEVRGRLTGDRIVADRITRVDEPTVRQLSGTIASVPVGGRLGTWVIDVDGGGTALVLVETAAVVDTRSAPAVVGALADVTAQVLEDGRLSALRIRTGWPY